MHLKVWGFTKVELHGTFPLLRLGKINDNNQKALIRMYIILLYRLTQKLT